MGRTNAPAGWFSQSNRRVNRKRSALPRASRRQGGELGRGERPRPPIAFEQQPRLGHVETAVGFEAPGVEADRQIIGEKVGTGEIEVNQPGNLALAEEDIVREKVGVNHSGRQVVRPFRLDQRKLGLQLAGELGLHFGRTGAASFV